MVRSGACLAIHTAGVGQDEEGPLRDYGMQAAFPQRGYEHVSPPQVAAAHGISFAHSK
jgi:hypothetical protein